MKKTVSILLISIFILSACQQAPSEVRERASGYGTNDNISEVEMEYISPSDLPGEIDEVLKTKTENLVLPTSNKYKIKNVYSGTIIMKKGETNKSDLYAEMFGVRDCKWVDCSIDNQNGNSDYMSESNNEYINVEGNGFCAYYDSIANQEDVTDEYDCITNPDSFVGKDEVITIGGQQARMSELLNFVQNQLDDKYGKLESDFEHKVYRICEKKLPNKSSMLTFMIERTIEGMPLNNLDRDYCEDDEGNQRMNTTFALMEVDMYKTNKISMFTNMTGGFEINHLQSIDRIISPQTAVRLVEKELSGYKKVEIREIRPMYDMKIVYEDKEKNKKPEDRPLKTHKEGRKIELIPVYCFMIPKKQKENDKMEGNENGYIKVNMISGDIMTKLEGIRYFGE